MLNQKNHPKTKETILSPDEVSQLLGRSKKTIWRWYSVQGCFPEPIKINGRALGWKLSTIDAFLHEK